MIRIDAITDLAGIVQFFVWAAVVHGVVHFLFRSYPAEALRAKMGAKQRPQIHKYRKLQWELQTKERFTDERARGDEMTAAQPLTEKELKDREKQLKELGKSSKGFRFLNYFMSCGFCQAVWISLVLLLICHRFDTIWLTVASAFAYTLPCGLIIRLLVPSGDAAARSKQGGCPGGDCGGR